MTIRQDAELLKTLASLSPKHLSIEDIQSDVAVHAKAILDALDNAERRDRGTREQRQSTDYIYVYDPDPGVASSHEPTGDTT